MVDFFVDCWIVGFACECDYKKHLRGHGYIRFCAVDGYSEVTNSDTWIGEGPFI